VSTSTPNPTGSGESHPQCLAAGEHICQVSSGRECVEQECVAPAGTLWGPMWCPPHDKDRLDRITASFAAIAAEMDGRARKEESR